MSSAGARRRSRNIWALTLRQAGQRMPRSLDKLGMTGWGRRIDPPASARPAAIDPFETFAFSARKYFLRTRPRPFLPTFCPILLKFRPGRPPKAVPGPISAKNGHFGSNFRVFGRFRLIFTHFRPMQRFGNRAGPRRNFTEIFSEHFACARRDICATFAPKRWEGFPAQTI